MGVGVRSCLLAKPLQPKSDQISGLLARAPCVHSPPPWLLSLCTPGPPDTSRRLPASPLPPYHTPLSHPTPSTPSLHILATPRPTTFQDFCADFAQNSLEPSNALSFLRQVRGGREWRGPGEIVWGVVLGTGAESPGTWGVLEVSWGAA